MDDRKRAKELAAARSDRQRTPSKIVPRIQRMVLETILEAHQPFVVYGDGSRGWWELVRTMEESGLAKVTDLSATGRVVQLTDKGRAEVERYR